MSGASGQPCEKVVRQAIQWTLRLRNDTNPRLHERCSHWRAANADHECAWQRIQNLDSELSRKFLALPGSGAAFETLENSAQRLGRRQALKLLSGVAVVGSATWMSRNVAPWQQWRADFATHLGERNNFRLADGTQLQLNTDSAVDQAFTPQQRLITLTRGEILVVPGADSLSHPPRPLRVQSRHGLFEAMGGRFIVRQDELRTRISVTEGRLLIRSPGALPINVRAGESYSVTAMQAAQLRDPDMDAAAWTEGLIVTRDMRLKDFLAEVARYRRGHLACSDDIADLRLSGVFRLEDTDKLLAVLPRTLPVELSYRTRWWVTLRRQA